MDSLTFLSVLLSSPIKAVSNHIKSFTDTKYSPSNKWVEAFHQLCTFNFVTNCTLHTVCPEGAMEHKFCRRQQLFIYCAGSETQALTYSKQCVFNMTELRHNRGMFVVNVYIWAKQKKKHADIDVSIKTTPLARGLVPPHKNLLALCQMRKGTKMFQFLSRKYRKICSLEI